MKGKTDMGLFGIALLLFGMCITLIQMNVYLKRIATALEKNNVR